MAMWLAPGSALAPPARGEIQVNDSAGGEIKSLTSLRGFAALAVVLQHFSATAQPLTPEWIPSIVPHGYMAVRFFFYLSGFIMCLTYLNIFQAKGLSAFPDFMMKRVARIVPLNVFALTLLMALGTLSSVALGHNIFFNAPSLPYDLAANLLMLQGLGVGYNLNAPSWSISTEFAAYFLFPLFVWLIFKAGPMMRAITLAAALIALCAVAAQMPRLGLNSLEVVPRLIETFAQFVLGMGSYILYRHRLNARDKVRAGYGNNDVEVGLLVSAIAVGLVIGIDLPVSLLFPFLVVAVALNRGRFARWLSGGLPYFLGVISFSVYLVHEPFRPLGVLFFNAIHTGPATAAEALVFAFVGSIVVIPFAWLTYIMIERPGRRLVRGWARTVASPVAVKGR